MGRSKALPSFSLSSFVSPSQDGDWYKKVGYQDAKNIIREKMKSSVENFIAIGYYLKLIDETGQYKEDGYANIWECAKQEFGFSQPKASRCINICKAYSVNGDSPYIDERFKNFNTSQLQEMLPFKDDERLIGQITPDMSSRKIRKEVQKAKKEDAGDMKESSPLQGRMQITAIEGEYREFTPASDISGEKDNFPDAQFEEKFDYKRVTIHLPAEVGDTVYFIEGDNDISKGTIDQITLGEGMKQQFRVHDTDGGGVWFHFEASDFGRMLFYSHEDAEAVKGFKGK